MTAPQPSTSDSDEAHPVPSFTRAMFAGVLDTSLLFPYPAPLTERDPDEAMLVRRLLKQLRELEGTLIDSARIDAEQQIPEEVIEALADIGILGLTIPREFGGLDLSASAYARVFGEISVIDPSVAVLVGVHCGLGSKSISLFGSAEQKARYLPPLARGETLAAYALTEPETGSDAQNLVTRAERSADGSRWILNGRKIWIGNGQRAGVIATFAQTEIERRGERVQRPTAFIIRPDMPGFRVVGTVEKLGVRGSTQAELAYENLEVPADHVLGTVGKGFKVAVNVLNAGRMTLSAGCTAGTKLLAKWMATYAEQRVQFGQPIAAFEITQRKLATLATELYAADAMLGILASFADQPDRDLSIEAACCKVFASEMLWRAADEMVQVAGGRGFVKPYPYERLLRDARINRIFEGTNEILRLFIALNGIQGPAERLKELGAALREPIRHLGLIGGYAATRVREAIGRTATLGADVDEVLANDKRYLEKHVAELGAAVDRVVMTHRKDIVERQMVLERLAEMGIMLFASAATIARTQRMIEDRGASQCEREIMLCNLFSVEAGKRFREHRQSLDSAEDNTRREVAAAVRRAGGYFVPDPILEK